MASAFPTGLDEKFPLTKITVFFSWTNHVGNKLKSHSSITVFHSAGLILTIILTYGIWDYAKFVLCYYSSTVIMGPIILPVGFKVYV